MKNKNLIVESLYQKYGLKTSPSKKPRTGLNESYRRRKNLNESMVTWIDDYADYKDGRFIGNASGQGFEFEDDEESALLAVAENYVDLIKSSSVHPEINTDRIYDGIVTVTWSEDGSEYETEIRVTRELGESYRRRRINEWLDNVPFEIVDCGNGVFKLAQNGIINDRFTVNGSSKEEVKEILLNNGWKESDFITESYRRRRLKESYDELYIIIPVQERYNDNVDYMKYAKKYGVFETRQECLDKIVELAPDRWDAFIPMCLHS